MNKLFQAELSKMPGVLSFISGNGDALGPRKGPRKIFLKQLYRPCAYARGLTF